MKKVACKFANQLQAKFILPELPYSKTDLEPYYSADLIELHYGKHHQTYVTNLNKLVEGSELEKLSLEEIIYKSSNDKSMVGIFNNAAQIWNHTFFWHCMKKNGGSVPQEELLNKINESFGSFEKFKNEFMEKATKLFGSGWCWLVVDNGQLKIVQTSNAGNPLTQGLKPILTLDVWEHAYYPDYQNRRPEFVEKFLDKLINWEFVYQVYSGECSEL